MEKTNELIKKRRLELGLTLRDVANSLGTAESTISRYESSNIQNMGIDKIIALSKVLKCSPVYLLGLTQHKEDSDIIFSEFDINDYTREELVKIREYAKFLKSPHFTDINEAKKYIKNLTMFAAYGDTQNLSDASILHLANIIYKNIEQN